LTAASFVLQKKAYLDHEKDQYDPKVKKVFYISKNWLTGFILVFVSSILNVATMPFLDMVVMS